MARTGSIVVGTDGSDRSERALDRAGELARLLGVKLHIVSCYAKSLDGVGRASAARGVPIAGDEHDGGRTRASTTSIERSSGLRDSALRARRTSGPGSQRCFGADRGQARRPDDHRRQPWHDRNAAGARIGAQPGIASCSLRRADRYDGLTTVRFYRARIAIARFDRSGSRDKSRLVETDSLGRKDRWTPPRPGLCRRARTPTPESSPFLRRASQAAVPAAPVVRRQREVAPSAMTAIVAV